jgi:ABC-type nitrate/sulfonate/bicarbonate transport system substrate-binding protein
MAPKFRVFAFVLAATISSAWAQPKTKMIIGTGVDPSLAQFYVAKEAGIFERNGLDVQLNQGPSGSAMIAFLIGDQIQAALGAELAGIPAHNLDANVAAAGESVQLPHFYGLVARHVDTFDALKGKKIGVDSGSSSQNFWLALVSTLHLDPKDYTIVQVEPPEMIAALERGDIDAFAAWEPWVTRALEGIPGTRNLRDNAGIIVPRDYVYMNRGWVERNKPAGQIAHLLKLDPGLPETLMAKVDYGMRLDNDSLAHMREIEAQLKQSGKLTKPVDWSNFFLTDPLRAAAPAAVTLDAPK